MADKKISQFVDGGTVLTTDEIATNRAGTNTKVFVKSGALFDVGSGAGQIPLTDDLGTAAFVDTGTDPSDVPLNSDLGSAAYEEAGTGIGDLLVIDDVDGSPGLPAIDGSQLTGLGFMYANVLDFGAVPDGVLFYTADMTNGSPLLSGGSFTAADVGKSIMVKGAGAAGADLVTTISAYVSPTSVNLAANAATTVNDAVAMYGTDNLTAIQDAIDSLAPFSTFEQAGGIVGIPNGTYYVSDSIDLTLKHGVWIVGESTKGTFIMSPNNDHIIGAIGSSTDITSRCGVFDLTIRGGGESLTASEGINFAWVNRGVVERVAFLSLRTCMVMTHQYQTRLEFSGAHGANFDRCHTGLLMTETTLTNIDNAVFATNLEFQGLSSTGFRIMNAQGSKFVNCEAGGAPMIYGWWIGEPSTGTVKVQWMHFVNCLADSVSGRGWNFQKGTATELSEIQMANCWSGNVNDTNLEFVGCSDFVIDNFQIITSANMGILFNGCTRMTLSNSQIKAYNANNTGSGWGILMQDTTHSKIIGTTMRSAFTSAPALAEGGTADYNIVTQNNVDNALTRIGANSIFIDNVINSVAFASNVRLQSAAATTSGTTKDYTSIPAGVREIRIKFVNVSTNGTSIPLIQIGDSGGIENSGYAGSSITNGTAAVYGGTGFALGTVAAASTWNGEVVLSLADVSSNAWVISGGIGLANAAQVTTTLGSKSLSAMLDRVRLTATNGTDTFDNGFWNISWKF